jgi:hypothetical protein
MASKSEQEAAQAPYKSTFARLGRSVWLTLESSFRATNDARTANLEEYLTHLGMQMRQVADLGVNWLAVGDFSKRRNGWTDDEWVAFLRLWHNYAGQVFGGAEGEYMTPEDAELYRAFSNYWTYYACAPERPKGAIEGDTLESIAQKVDELLIPFVERLGDPTVSCASCGTGTLGYKLKRCSRCKQVCYCSVDCQKAHWRSHKKVCQKEKE